MGGFGRVHPRGMRPGGLYEATRNAVAAILAKIGRGKSRQTLRAREERLRVLAEAAFEGVIISEGA